jgi:hypothetical protein
LAAKAGVSKTPFVVPKKTAAQAAPNALPAYTTAQMNAYNRVVNRKFIQQLGQQVGKTAPFPPGSAPQPASIQGNAGTQVVGGKLSAVQFASAARAAARKAAVRSMAINASAAQAKRGGLSKSMQSQTGSAAFYARTQASAAAQVAAGANAAATIPSSPKTAVGVKKSEGPWITAGNDEKYDCCIAVAIANHLWISTGLRLTDEQVWMLHAVGGGEDVEQTLEAASSGELWDNVHLEDYAKLETGEPLEGALLISFPTDNGDHVALLLPDGKMASWGESYPVPDHVEEAWALKWQMTTTS